MNDNRDRKKGSATPWLLGASALGLGGIGLALARKGKAKTGSVLKQVKKAATVDVPKPKVQQLGAAKPQLSIKDELNQLKNQGQPKAKQADMQDELDRMRSEAPKSTPKPANMDDELGRMRSGANSQTQPKVEEVKPKIKYRLNNINPKFDGKKTYKSGVSGYGGLSPEERRAKLDRRRRDLADASDVEINKKRSKEELKWRTDDRDLRYNKDKGKYERSPLRRIVKKGNPLYWGTEEQRVRKNANLRNDNKQRFLEAVDANKKRGTEYNAHIFLLCDL